MGFFAGIKVVERGPRALEANSAADGVDQVERYEPAEAAPVLRLDHEVRRGACDRVEYNPAQRAADAIDARHVGADRETGHVVITHLSCLLFHYICCYYTGVADRSTRFRHDRAAVVDEATDAVLLVSRALVGVAAKSLAATEGQITLRQYRALVVLDSRGDQNVGTLAEILGIHPSTLTRLCDRLIEKKLIERNTSGESRREVTLALSEKGRALVRAETNRRRRAIREIVARLEPSTQSALADVFNAFAVAADEVRGHAWKLGWTA